MAESGTMMRRKSMCTVSVSLSTQDPASVRYAVVGSVLGYETRCFCAAQVRKHARAANTAISAGRRARAAAAKALRQYQAIA